MRAIAPRTGAPEHMIAEDQLEYTPLVVAAYVYKEGTPEQGRGLLSRWTFTPEERTRIAAGEDMYIMQLCFDTPPRMSPMQVQVGPEGFLVPETPDGE